MKINKPLLWSLALLVILITASYTLNQDAEHAVSDDGTIMGHDLKESSLLFAAITIGLLDGFNPCAMWVLLYLITMASQMKDKKRMWIIVSIFLLSSGILYFMILMGWTGLFSLIAVRPVMIAIGLFAIGAGIHQLHGYYKTGGEVVCEVGDATSRKKTMTRIEQLMEKELTFMTIIATISLAFIINAIEFACSIGLPVVFAGLLNAAELSLWGVVFYNLIYTLAFMLDDLIVFSVAIFALQSIDLNKYSGYSKLIGGLLMLLIGIVLIFFPQFLS